MPKWDAHEALTQGNAFYSTVSRADDVAENDTWNQHIVIEVGGEENRKSKKLQWNTRWCQGRGSLRSTSLGQSCVMLRQCPAGSSSKHWGKRWTKRTLKQTAFAFDYRTFIWTSFLSLILQINVGFATFRTGMSHWNTYHKCAKNITRLENI